MNHTLQTKTSTNSTSFPWECTCGELHRTAFSAVTCCKCRDYVPGEPTSARNILTFEELGIQDFRLNGQRR